nr:hypothetical protein [Tanacetum cinerariifolium]
SQRDLPRDNPLVSVEGLSDGTLTRILEALAYRFKGFKIKRLNPGTPPSMSQTILNIDAHVDGEQFYESKQSRADLQEHTIAEKDFKNLHPSDFEDLNLLLLQGHLDHLLGFDKQMLSTAAKLWTQNLVIRQWVEDFQLGIESYPTQLNLTKPGTKDYVVQRDLQIQ